jgi:cation:H+ antiporter
MTNPLLFPVLQFGLCAAIIFWSGARLSRYGDWIAVETGLGGTWVGLLLLAVVTSLPELIAGASAIVVFDVPDIAAGDTLGSCMFNLFVLALLDVREPDPLSARMHQGHVLSAAFGILQLGGVTLALFAGAAMPALAWVGAQSLLAVGIYGLAMRALFAFERSRMLQVSQQLIEQQRPDGMGLRRSIVLCAGTALVLVAAAVYLPRSAERIAEETGIAQTIAGSLLVAAATSLPECAVSVAAARLGALDMAAANLLGSNLFNVAILGIDDLLYTRGPLLEAVHSSHGISAVGATLMTAIAVIGFTYRASHKRYVLSWDSIASVLVYGACTALLIAVT